MKKLFKITFTLICALTIVNYSYCQLPSYGDLGFMNTYKENKFYWGLSFNTFGKIKSIDQTKYRLVKKAGVLKKGRKIGNFDNDSNYHVKFDEQGRVIEMIDYHTPSNLRTYTYKYDEFENLIEVNVFDSYGNCVRVEKYNYNEFGKLIQEEFIQENTYIKYSHNYDENENNIETFYTELHGYPLLSFLLDVFVLKESLREEDVCLRIFKSYDENGNLLQEMTYNSNCNWDITLKTLRDVYKCEYDDNGKLVKEIKIMDRIAEAKSTIELNHYYSEVGLKTGTKLIFDFGGLKWYINTRIIRDSNGRIIEIIEDQKNSLKKKTIQFNQKFEYDTFNNISKIYFFKKNKPKYIIEREIKYY